MLLLSLVSSSFALDAHGFSFEGVTGDVEDYARQGYPTAGIFGDGDLSLVLDYARDPLTELTPEGRSPVLSALGTATLSGAFSFGAMRLEAALPVHPIGTDSSGDFSAIGDAKLGAMVPVPWMGPHIPLMAVHTVVSFPTGDPEHYVSAGGPRFTGTFVAAQEFGPVGVVGTVGGVVSRPEEERNLKAGLGPVLGLGTSYRFDERFSGALEFTGESEYGFSSFPIEATLSGRYRSEPGAWATAGLATGLTSGVGSSRWRVFLGVGWSFREENHKNLEPEAVVGEVDPEADRDGDGIHDLQDACPDQKETVDGFTDEDGCPELDGDGDGVAFEKDLCPREPIRPEQDPRYSDGCPKTAEISGDRIVITETIYFAEGRADLLPESTHVLTAVRDLLEAHPEVGPVLVEGHTNSNGSDAFNLRLSDARAYAVMSWLVDHGIDPIRLISKGYGETQPLVAETDAASEAVNRRVEFHLLSVSDGRSGARQVEVSAEELKKRRRVAAGLPAEEPPVPPSKNKRGKTTSVAVAPQESAAPKEASPALQETSSNKETSPHTEASAHETPASLKESASTALKEASPSNETPSNKEASPSNETPASPKESASTALKEAAPPTEAPAHEAAAPPNETPSNKESASPALKEASSPNETPSNKESASPAPQEKSPPNESPAHETAASSNEVPAQKASETAPPADKEASAPEAKKDSEGEPQNTSEKPARSRRRPTDSADHH